MRADTSNERRRAYAQDHWPVYLEESWEVVFWTRELRCSEQQLRSAVVSAGPTVGAVREYLAERRM